SVSPAHSRRVAARASTPADATRLKELGEQRAALVLPLFADCFFRVSRRLLTLTRLANVHA
ncbi:MAG TPA: hypothetical protein VLW51_10850, partial [Solirubrobacteraceae bacterium]|nr:hypothetical protein [Solirubrobacteraceae bacterium]